MASTWLWIILIGLLVCKGQSVIKSNPVKANLGENVTLPCPCPQRKPDLDSDLIWQINTTVVYHLKHSREGEIDKSYQNRTQIYLTLDSTNCSILLSRVHLSDEGVYTCYYYKGRALKQVDVILKVTAPYHCDYFFNESHGRYHCKARGGYPKAEIFWMMNDSVIKTATRTQSDNHTGLYELSSDLHINSSTSRGKIRCVVNNTTCSQVTQDTSRETKSTTVPLICTSLSMLGLLVLLLGLQQFGLLCKKSAAMMGAAMANDSGTGQILLQQNRTSSHAKEVC